MTSSRSRLRIRWSPPPGPRATARKRRKSKRVSCQSSVVGESAPMSAGGIREIVAERILTVENRDGSIAHVSVRLGKPQLSPEGQDFFCEVQLCGDHDTRIQRVFGLDGFQALQLSIRYVRALLDHYAQQLGCVVYWTERGDDMGFPEIPSMNRCCRL